MTSTPRAREILREATREHHERVDAVFSTAALGRRQSYTKFLVAQAAAHLPAEDVLDRAGVATLIPDWQSRRRAALLRADLAALGAPVPPPAGRLELDGAPELLGALYVLEGSRLGGAMLKRSVPDELPSSFLGGVDSSAWRSLLATLDARLGTASSREAAVRAARDVFSLFENAGRRHLNIASCG